MLSQRLRPLSPVKMSLTASLSSACKHNQREAKKNASDNESGKSNRSAVDRLKLYFICYFHFDSGALQDF